MTSPSFSARIRKVKVFSPDEERAASYRIVGLRSRLWELLLCYRPHAEAIVDYCVSHASDMTLGEGDEKLQLERLLLERCSMVAATVNDLRPFRAAVAQAAIDIAELDRESVVANDIIEAIERAADGEHNALSLAPMRSRRRSAERLDAVLGARDTLNRAREDFAMANIRFVLYAARRLSVSMSMEDRIQVGFIGLLKAVDRFDPRLGFRFTTYAGWWIRHTICRNDVDETRTVALPQYVHDRLRRIKKQRKKLSVELGRDPTLREVAEATGYTTAQVRETMMVFREIVSIGDQAHDALRGDDMVDDSPSALDKLELSSSVAEMRAAISELDVRDRTILVRRFGLDGDEPATLRELSKEYGLTKERIRQIQAAAVDTLRGRVTV